MVKIDRGDNGEKMRRDWREERGMKVERSERRERQREGERDRGREREMNMKFYDDRPDKLFIVFFVYVT